MKLAEKMNAWYGWIGLFTAVGKLADAKLLTEAGEKEYWMNRAYVEENRILRDWYGRFGLHD